MASLRAKIKPIADVASAIGYWQNLLNILNKLITLTDEVWYTENLSAMIDLEDHSMQYWSSSKKESRAHRKLKASNARIRSEWDMRIVTYANLQADVQQAISIWKERLMKEDVIQRLRTTLLARLSTVGLRLTASYRFPIPSEIVREDDSLSVIDRRAFTSALNQKLCYCSQDSCECAFKWTNIGLLTLCPLSPGPSNIGSTGIWSGLLESEARTSMERLFLGDDDINSSEFARTNYPPCEIDLGLVPNSELRSEAPKSIIIPDWGSL
jgi:hypothetical protein